MADEDRSEKLAAARKKLKAFQHKSNKTVVPATATNKTKEIPVQNPHSDFLSNKQPELSLEVDNRFPIVDKKHGPSSTSSISDTDTIQSTSSSENLRQISMQLNGLVSETCEFRNGKSDENGTSISLLETRNQELASGNETLKLDNVQLTHLVQSYKAQVSELQNKYKKDMDETGERYLKEQGSLREQLQVHIQTIGILVAEKTELQSSLGQFQQTAKQKAGEVEELQGRLKASRQRLSDLERELASTSVSSHKLEKNSKENVKEIDRLKMDNYKISKTNEGLQHLNSELNEKLSVKLSECHSQEERIDDLQKKLAMSELRVRQLNSVNNEEETSQLEVMQNEKVQLENKIAQLGDTIQKLSSDRDQINENHQMFSKQLNQQIHNLNEQVALVSSEREVYKNQSSSLEERLEVLQRQLDDSRHSEEGKFRKDEKASILEATVSNLEAKLAEVKKDYETQIADNSQLSRLVEDGELRIEQLEAQIADTHGLQVDREKLLETMQSDKVAASRAMVQNKELKKQLEELQNGFVKMSNDKLVLTEKAQEEQHISKELGERLSQQEEELKELRDQLQDKEHQLSMLQKNSTELTKHMYQQHQLADRMRHFEAQGQLTEMLQQELNQAQERMGALIAQNSELRTMLANQAEKLLKSSSGDGVGDRDMNRKDDMVASLSASVRQLELERNQLLRQLDEQRLQREAFKQQLQDLNPSASVSNENIATTNGFGGDHDNENDDDDTEGAQTTVSVADYRSLKQTMEKLEGRFTKTMKDIAQLSDEKQQLEYLVLQLQGETETIGDYIALYQTQRNVMKQQISKKDEYITLVCRDREELKEKLTKLQELVYKLLFERQQTQKSGRHLSPPGKAKPANSETSLSLENLDWPGMLDQIDELSAKQEALSAPPSPSTEFAPDGPSFTANSSSKPASPAATNPAKTARRIIDLISEIGSTNLMQKTVPDNFHPCIVCSGRLMTI